MGGSLPLPVATAPSTRRRDIAYGCATALALLASGVAAAIALNGADEQPALVACLRALVTGLPLLVGLHALRDRRRPRFAALLMLAGILAFVSTLAESPDPTAYTIGRIAGWFLQLFVIYMALAYPSGRLETRTDRIIAVAALTTLVVFFLPRLVIADDFPTPNPYTSCLHDCPRNVLFALDTEPAFVDDVVTPLGALALLSVTAAAAIRLIRRYATARPHARRALAPVLLVAAVLIALVGVAMVARISEQSSPAIQAAAWTLALTAPAIALAFLVGVLRSKMFAARALGLLAVRLRAEPDAPTLELAFAEAFDDPSVELLFPASRSGTAWRSSTGHPVPLPEEPRHVTRVFHNRRLVAGLAHDTDLLTEPELLAAGTAMAGVALDNQRLAADAAAAAHEIERSRARLAARAVAERRRIERDLHDGAQQRLVALRIELGLAEDLVDRDPERAALRLQELGHAVEEALEDLRSLTHGIASPLLTASGLVEALRSAATRVRLPVQVEAYGVQRYPPETESAVYFCVLEALQNVLKHAPFARRVVVTLVGGYGGLRFTVRDDGAGVPQDKLVPGAGLRNMADRLAAVGGQMEISSTPLVGTVVRGRVPLRPMSVGTPSAVVPTPPSEPVP
jgi:signal transduction histidine kinase